MIQKLHDFQMGPIEDPWEQTIEGPFFKREPVLVFQGPDEHGTELRLHVTMVEATYDAASALDVHKEQVSFAYYPSGAIWDDTIWTLCEPLILVGDYKRKFMGTLLRKLEG